MRDRLGALAVVAAVICGGASAAVAAVTGATAAANWSLAPVPKPTGAGTALAGVDCFSSTGCLAVGERSLGTGEALPVAERWNGSKWIEQAVSGLGSQGAGLDAVSCPSATTCTVVGTDRRIKVSLFATFAERRVGSKWSIERTPNPVVATFNSDLLNAVSCSSVRACTAVGAVTNRNGTIGYPLIERWNGKHWALQPGPHSLQGSLDGVSCPSARTCIAVGSMGDPAGTMNTPLILRWTGSSWGRMSVAMTPGVFLSSVVCVSSSACITVGATLAQHLESPLVERLHGGHWVVQHTPVPPAPDSQGVLYGVSCTAAAACTAAGSAEDSSGDEVGPLIEDETGGGWTLQSAPGPAAGPAGELSGLSAVSCLPGERCLAVGFAGNHPFSVRHP